MSDPAPAGLLPAARALAGEAARVVLDVYRGEFDVSRKGDGSPVTRADLAAHAVLAAGLPAIGDYPVLSEEARIPDFAERASWRRYWLVDPLDGTLGFVRRNGEFAVNIALVEAGSPILGVVCLPDRDVCYTAARGSGAQRWGPHGARDSIRVRSADRAALTVATSRSRRNPRTRVFVDGLAPTEIILVGSAIKTCLVAEGSADAYPGFSTTSEWDTAAPQCVLEEAGGRLVDLAGRPLRYNTTPSTDNPPFLALGDARIDWLRYVPAPSREG